MWLFIEKSLMLWATRHDLGRHTPHRKPIASVTRPHHISHAIHRNPSQTHRNPSRTHRNSHATSSHQSRDTSQTHRDTSQPIASVTRHIANTLQSYRKNTSIIHPCHHVNMQPFILFFILQTHQTREIHTINIFNSYTIIFYYLLHIHSWYDMICYDKSFMYYDHPKHLHPSHHFNMNPSILSSFYRSSNTSNERNSTINTSTPLNNFATITFIIVEEWPINWEFNHNPPPLDEVNNPWMRSAQQPLDEVPCPWMRSIAPGWGP